MYNSIYNSTIACVGVCKCTCVCVHISKYNRPVSQCNNCVKTSFMCKERCESNDEILRLAQQLEECEKVRGLH